MLLNLTAGHEKSVGALAHDALSIELCVQLDAERTAATASVFDVGVIELKPGAFQGFDVVHLGTVEVEHTGLVDKDLQAIKTICLIKEIRGILEGHRVAEPRAPSADHGNPKPARAGLLGVQNLFYLGDCRFG